MNSDQETKDQPIEIQNRVDTFFVIMADDGKLPEGFRLTDYTKLKG